MYSCGLCVVVFFFKQKTAYEMRISDWSSDVCSSDLQQVINFRSKLLWQPSDNAKVILTGEFFDQNSTTNSPQPVNGNTAGRRFPGVILPTDAWQASLTSIPTLDLRRWSAALHVKLEFDGFNLEATSGFMNLRWYQETDSDRSEDSLVGKGWAKMSKYRW